MFKTTLSMIIFGAGLAFADSEVSNNTQSTTQLLEKIVAFPTVKGRGQVPVMAEYLAKQLIAGGFSPKEIEIERVGETATLVAHYPGNQSKRPMIIANHMDVVEAHREDWTRDPFTLVSENGYLYGRGVYDNKLDLALVISTVLRLKKEKFVPSRDLILVFSGDEETEMETGKRLSKRFPTAEFLLNGDAGGGSLSLSNQALSYSLETAEKTYVNFTVSASNPGGHSSHPGKKNAIYDLASALLKLESYQFPVRSAEETRSYFAFTGKQLGGTLGRAMVRFSKNPSDKKAAATIAKNPDYAAYLRTTCVATQIKGGHAENALPQQASATVNCRIFIGESVESVQSQLVRAIHDSTVKVEQQGLVFTSPNSPMRNDITTAVRKAVDHNFPGAPVIRRMSLGSSDSLFFRAQGIPSYGVSGAYLRPEDDFSHGLNERVPVEAIPLGLAHWYILITELAK